VKPKKSYSELLRDPEWQKKRLKILERDNWTCQLCFSKDKTLHVHHLIYFKNYKPWDYDNNCLLTLCEKCHQDEENLKKSNFDLNILSKLSLTPIRKIWHISFVLMFCKTYNKARYDDIIKLLNSSIDDDPIKYDEYWDRLNTL
jgi:hypothetical protein